MNFSAKSNMYSVARDQVLERYAAHVSTPTDSCAYQFCVISYRKSCPAVAQALQNSAPALGYDKNGYFSVSILPDDSDAAHALDPANLFDLIEGIDPFAVIVVEKEAAALVEEAYSRSNEPIAPDEPHDTNALGNSSNTTPSRSKAFSLPRDAYLHLLGRDAVIFSSFEAMLANPAAKQRAWALLKKLKR